MSGPKKPTYPTVTYNPPPPPPPAVYYTHSFDIGGNAEAREAMAILSKLSGVSIKVENGKIVATYSSYSSWNLNSLKDIIENARKQAIQNIEYVKKAKENALKALESALTREEEVYNNNLSLIEEDIATLEEILRMAKEDLISTKVSISFAKEIKDIQAALTKLKTKRTNMMNKHTSFVNEAETYSNSINTALTSIDMANAEKLRPSYYASTYETDTDLGENSLIWKKKIETAKAYLEAVNKFYDFIKDEGLQEYQVRLDDKIKACDPFDPDSVKALEKVLKDIIDEREFKLQDELNQKMESASIDTVRAQLDILKELSKALKPLTFKLEDNNIEVDVSESNEAIVEQIKNALNSANKLNYLSRDNSDLLKNLKNKLKKYKGNLNNPKITIELNKILKEVTRLMESAVLENEKYEEYLQALNDYTLMRDQLMGNEESGGINIKDSSKFIFSMDEADSLIANLKEGTKEMMKIIKEVSDRAVISSIASAVSEQIFSKEEDNGQFSFSYVRPEDKGVLYIVENGPEGSLISPVGVMLSSGVKVIEEDGLKKVHSSCEWFNELNEKLVKVGMPPLTAEEVSEEEKEALYQEENYYFIEDDEESIRYLRKCGYSDEEIFEIFHYDTNTLTYVGEASNNTSRTHKRTIKKSLHKDKDDK